MTLMALVQGSAEQGVAVVDGEDGPGGLEADDAGADVGVGVDVDAAADAGAEVADVAAEGDATAAATGVGPVADVDADADAGVGIALHQMEGRPEAAGCCEEVERMAAWVGSKGNDAEVVREGVVGSATVAAGRLWERGQMRRAKCRSKGLSRRMQLGGCCGVDWGWGRMQLGL
jgi:hypothetical protein